MICMDDWYTEYDLSVTYCTLRDLLSEWEAMLKRLCAWATETWAAIQKVWQPIWDEMAEIFEAYAGTAVEVINELLPDTGEIAGARKRSYPRASGSRRNTRRVAQVVWHWHWSPLYGKR